MAVGCYEASRELGLRVPSDIAGMGYDEPGDHPALASAALDSVIAAFRNGKHCSRDSAWPFKRPPHTKVECPLVLRGSM
jgi:LacI family transcriptional regulator